MQEASVPSVPRTQLEAAAWPARWMMVVALRLRWARARGMLEVGVQIDQCRSAPCLNLLCKLALVNLASCSTLPSFSLYQVHTTVIFAPCYVSRLTVIFAHLTTTPTSTQYFILSRLQLDPDSNSNHVRPLVCCIFVLFFLSPTISLPRGCLDYSFIHMPDGE